jgi:hypothetical protein
MRIICWNIAGEGPAQEDLARFLEYWAGDEPTVVIFLEPASWMKARAGENSPLEYRNNKTRNSVKTGWLFKKRAVGYRQGHVCVAYRNGETTIKMDSTSVPNQIQDNHLVFIDIMACKTDERLCVATCHTPYAKNSGAAYTYLEEAARLVCAGRRPAGVRTTFAFNLDDYDLDTLPRKRRGMKQEAGDTGGLVNKRSRVPPRNVDVWLGDFNTYGNTAPRNALPTMKLILAEPSSGFRNEGNNNSKLDKILVVATMQVARVGRILPGGFIHDRTEAATKYASKKPGSGSPAKKTYEPPKKSSKRLKGIGPDADENPGQAGADKGVTISDFTESSWPRFAQIRSDHAPIYLDTIHTGNPIGAGASGSDSSKDKKQDKADRMDSSKDWKD